MAAGLPALLSVLCLLHFPTSMLTTRKRSLVCPITIRVEGKGSKLWLLKDDAGYRARTDNCRRPGHADAIAKEN